MRPDDLLELLRAQPFEPFRIHLSDGTSFEFKHPDMAIVLKSKVIIAVPGPKGPARHAARSANCDLAHITRTELLNGASTK